MNTLLQSIFDKLLFDKKVLTQFAFAKKLGYTEGHISSALKMEYIPAKMQKKLHDVFGVSKIWMASNGEQGEMFDKTGAKDDGPQKPDEDQENNGVHTPKFNPRKDGVKQITHTNYMEVPYLPATAQAGYVAGFTENHIPNMNELETKLVPKEFEKGNYLVIELIGDSMDDGTDRTIAEGDELLAKELSRSLWALGLNYKRYLFIIVTRDGAICKQIIKQEQDIITCHSFNSHYSDFKLSLDTDVLQLFYVKKIVGKQIRL